MPSVPEEIIVSRTDDINLICRHYKLKRHEISFLLQSMALELFEYYLTQKTQIYPLNPLSLNYVEGGDYIGTKKLDEVNTIKALLKTGIDAKSVRVYSGTT
ncbi:hypothetical protein RCL1_004418 [Eukaryota sp. TZLM3-RCL]